MKKRREIRIIDPSKEILETVIKMAETEKRTIGKQAEYMLEWYINQQNKK